MKKAFSLLLFFAVPAMAEDIDLSADDGFEWNQKTRQVFLRKNASARTKDYSLVSDEIEGSYEDGAKKRITRIIARGSVVVKSEGRLVKTDLLDYDMLSEVVTLTSVVDPTDMRSGETSLSARGLVVYYRAKGYATAGKVSLSDSSRTLDSDSVRIDFMPDGGIRSVAARGNVVLVDGQEELFGDAADYDPATGLATVTGRVRFKKGLDASVDGDRIIYDMKTGVARILPKENERVKGTFKTSGGRK
jgi:lipopolysaccharide export system protein LptA